MTDTLSVQRPRTGVAVLQLNRPERLNAINDVMVGELTQTLAALGSDSSVNAVVLTGAGRGFCSGIDMRDFGPRIPEATAPAIDRLRFQETMAALPQAVRDIPQPVIAAVNGPCVGAGLALCLASDIRICSTAATFGNAAILLGLSGAEMGMSYFLPRIVGTSVAADWMLTGRTVAAEEADRRGLVSEIVAPENLVDRALEIAISDSRTHAAGRAVDETRAAGQRRRRRIGTRTRTREPQPGTQPCDRRGRGPSAVVVVMTGPLRGVRVVRQSAAGRSN